MAQSKTKKNTGSVLKSVIIPVVMALIIVLAYYLLANRDKEAVVEDNTPVTPVQEVLLRNLDKNYPPSPKEVVKYYSDLTKCLYNENCTDDEIEQMVESYRRSLYVQKYEEQLLSQRVSTQLSNDTVLSFYEANSDRFILSENILQGILIVTPKKSPQLKELRKWLKKGIDEIENIERFAYQYASAYQLFTDSWQKVNTIAENTPLDAVDLSKQMAKHNLIETTDSTSIYILSITDKRFAGDSMPFEFAEPEIRNLLLQQRKIDFIKQYEQQTYFNWKNQTK